MQSQRSFRRVAKYGESSANALRIDVKQKNIHFHDRKAVKLKRKCLFKSLIQLIISEGDITLVKASIW